MTGTAPNGPTRANARRVEHAGALRAARPAEVLVEVAVIARTAKPPAGSLRMARVHWLTCAFPAYLKAHNCVRFISQSTVSNKRSRSARAA